MAYTNCQRDDAKLEERAVDANDAMRMMVEASGKSGRQVAREIGISHAQVSRLEKSALSTMRKYI